MMMALAVEHELRQPDCSDCRLLQLTDSYVSRSVIAKSMSFSRPSHRCLRRLAAYLLACSLHLLVGHVDSRTGLDIGIGIWQRCAKFNGS